MSMKDRLKEDVKQAMKAGQKDKIAVIRMLLSEIQYTQTAGEAAKELNDQETIKVIQSYYKKLAKSLDEFADLAKKAVIQSEMGIIEQYLPKKADEAETLSAIQSILQKTEDRNFGNLMKLVMAQLGDSADGATISKLLKSGIPK